jgi:hypothetical protein
MRHFVPYLSILLDTLALPVSVSAQQPPPDATVPPATALAAPIRSFVTVTGVGFFDFLRDARGQAPNGFELHPVVSVVIDQMTSPPGR